jgi:retron-type reverse transcriptase
VNTGDLWPSLEEAEPRVLRMQAKLHQWATDSPDRRFCDLFNLVADPAFLVVAWHRVRGNRGARPAGVDGVKPSSILFGDQMIPKANGKRRRLGIPTMQDRIVQGALKLVLEPIFEADFQPCSYGFRPNTHEANAPKAHRSAHLASVSDSAFAYRSTARAHEATNRCMKVRATPHPFAVRLLVIAAREAEARRPTGRAL